jgi:signal transduction histidine kinase/ligand-binding sensor domain-containing protein
MMLICVVAHSKSADMGGFLMDVWTSDSGLPDSSVTAIAQTPDGYIWIGTYNGLARFDGVRFETFDPINTPALKNARITGLFVDARGTLWINTNDGSMTSLRNGIFTHEWQGGKVFSVFSKADQVFFALSSHNSRMVFRTETSTQHGEWKDLPLVGQTTGYSFKQDASGAIWYIQNGIPYRITGTNSEPFLPNSGWPGERVICLSTDSGGRIWAGTDKGIARWKGGRFEDQTPAGEQPDVNVSALYCTSNGCWVFGNGKVRKCVDQHWVAEADAESWRDLARTFQLDLNAFQDRDGNMWFAHLGSGLFHITEDGKTEHYTTDDGLPSNLASCWFQDHEGNIWSGLIRGGLVCLRKKQFHVIGKAEGLGSPAISSVCEDSRSNVWIGTFSGGLYRWQNGKLDRFNLPEGAYKECFFSTYPDSQHRLWLSAGREDLYTLADEQISPFATVVHGIKTILVDKQSRVWLGKVAGVACLTDGILNNFPATNGLNDIRALAEDRAGGVWIGTGEGNLFLYENGDFNRYQTHDDKGSRAIWSLLPEEDGTLWVGTVRGGLLRFKDGKFTRYTMQDGLPNDIICQILDDGLGKLWMGSHKGIFHVAKKAFQDFDDGKIQSLPCVSYGLPDGLPTLECSGSYQPTCWRGHDGRLWFATSKGLVTVQPGDLSVNRLPPPVMVEEILVDGKRCTWSSNSAPILISPGKHQLDFRYTALSFMAPDKVAFRYKLEGLDEDWIDGTTKRSAHYGPLPPGKYRFQVIACNNDGVWNETGATVHLVMLPHFWQTWWFFLLVIVFSLGIVAGAVRFVVTRKLERKLEHLKQQHALERERERIAQDLHDDLGSTLTEISMLAGSPKRTAKTEEEGNALAEIAQRSDHLVRAMDEIVWAVNPRHDSVRSLAEYLSAYARDFLATAGIRSRLDVQKDLPELLLKPEQRHELFHTVKEAVRNAGRHAQASEVWLRIKVENQALRIGVEDDGRGFDPASVAEGNGLRNMRERLARIGGSCVIQKGCDKGTMVEIKLLLV